MVKYILYFARRYLFAPRLDNLVHASHKIQVAIGVHTEQITGIAHTFARQWTGPKPRSRCLGSIPIPAHHVLAAYDKLSDLVWTESPAVRALDPHFRPWNRFADR